MYTQMRQALTIDADGNTGEIRLESYAGQRPWSILLGGNFDGATVKVQAGCRDDTGTILWADITDMSYMDNAVDYSWTAPEFIRLNASSSGASTSVAVFVG